MKKKAKKEEEERNQKKRKSKEEEKKEKKRQRNYITLRQIVIDFKWKLEIHDEIIEETNKYERDLHTKKKNLRTESFSSFFPIHLLPQLIFLSLFKI